MKSGWHTEPTTVPPLRSMPALEPFDQQLAEDVIGGEEEPVLAELRHGAGRSRCPSDRCHRPNARTLSGAQALPVKSAEPALVSSTVLWLLLGRVDDREGDRGIDQIGDGVHLVDIEPARGDAGADIGLVLMIGGEDLDGLAVDLAAEFLGRHVGGLDRALAGILLVGAGEIGQYADPDLVVGDLSMRGAGRKRQSQ